MTPFQGIVGHERVVALLDREISRPAHAYLFVGPAGVGKATVARRFAASLLSSEGESEDRVLRGLHPDLVLVEPDGRTALTVDRARTTVARAMLTPVEAARKVFLFEEAGLMNDQAANALLKTLEEPTATTVFVLVTESEDDLPATVVSRSRSVRFGRVSEDAIERCLLDEGLEPERASEVARIAGGRPGLALSLARQSDVWDFRRTWLSVPERLTSQPGEAFQLAEEVVAATGPLLEALARDDSEDTKEGKERQDREARRAAMALNVSGLEILSSWYRDAAAAQFGAPVRNRDVPARGFASIRPQAAIQRAERVLQTVEVLQANQKPELAFASLFAELATIE